MKKINGFTLIELIIAVAIIGILTALTYPTYINFLLQSRRTDALTALIQAQFTLESCYAQNFSYIQKCGLLPTFPHPSEQGYYYITLTHLGTSTYTLQATPTGTQTKDKQCTNFTLNQTNVKTAIDATDTIQPDCWNPK